VRDGVRGSRSLFEWAEVPVKVPSAYGSKQVTIQKNRVIHGSPVFGCRPHDLFSVKAHDEFSEIDRPFSKGVFKISGSALQFTPWKGCQLLLEVLMRSFLGIVVDVFARINGIQSLPTSAGPGAFCDLRPESPFIVGFEKGLVVCFSGSLDPIVA